MNSCAASIALSMASRLLVSMAPSVRLTPSFASASMALDNFLSWLFSAATSLTRSLLVVWWPVPLPRISCLPGGDGVLRSKRRCRRKVSPDSAVPDVLRHRQLDAGGRHQWRMVPYAFLFEQHHVLPDMLAAMPGRALQKFMQSLCPIIGRQALA